MEKYIKENKEDVIYFTQRNNHIFPMRSCFPTSVAMALRNNGYTYDTIIKHPTYGDMQLDDALMYIANSEIGKSFADKLKIPRGTPFLNEWWSVMEKVANHVGNPQGISCKWTTLDVDGIINQIKKGKMVVLGTKFTGSGHIVTVSGYNEFHQLIVCDPYGNPNNYYNVVANKKNSEGKNIVLTSDTQKKITNNCLIFS